MNDREKEVFEIIINHYLQNGESVGSRTLEKKYNMGVSSATIRNVMADLEEMGLITKTHSSSGRIPTLEGYKIYIEKLLKTQTLSDIIKEKIFDVYEKSLKQSDTIFSEITKLLSKLTSSVAIALEPKTDEEIIKKVKFIKINDKNVFVVVVMENDIIKTSTLSMKISYITEENVENLNKYIENLINTTHKRFCLKELERFLKNIGETDFKVENKKIFENNKIFVEGISNLLNQSDVELDKMIDVIKFVSDDKYLKSIFQKMADICEYDTKKATIIFGQDLKEEILKDYVFIFQCYNFGNEKGLIGIMSPTRVNYSKVVSILEMIIQILKLMLNRNSDKKYLCDKN